MEFIEFLDAGCESKNLFLLFTPTVLSHDWTEAAIIAFCFADSLLFSFINFLVLVNRSSMTWIRSNLGSI